MPRLKRDDAGGIALAVQRVAPPSSGEERGEIPPELVRVYEYGCGRVPLQGLDVAIEQMRRRNELWNRIVEIDNDIRTRMESGLFAGPQEEELVRLRNELDQARAQLLRSRKAGSISHVNAAREKLKLALARVRESLQVVKQARKDNANKNREVLRELDAERLRRIREVQGDPGLYWCGRMEVIRNYQVARARAMRVGRRLQPRVWNETGRVCVYFQKGLATDAVFASNGRLQVDPVPDLAWNAPTRAIRRRMAQTMVRLRIGVRADRTPTWFELPMTMHRPLPERGIIRRAVVVRERVGLSFRHRLLLTVRMPASEHMPQASGAVGIDAGWRVTANGLRVAYWCDTVGGHGELVVPNSDISEFRRIHSLQSTITIAHKEIKTTLQSLIESHRVPTAVAELAPAALASSSPREMAALFERWVLNRVAGDEGAFKTIETWHKQHVHLWTWQANLRDQLIKRRRELYRRFASELLGRYGVAFLNDIQLQRKTVRPQGSATEAIPAQRQNRFIAAVSILYRTIEQAFEKHRARAMRVRPDKATVACHVCGAVDDWNPRTSVEHTCSGCGSTWDQDHNAAIHVLKHGLAGTKLADS